LCADHVYVPYCTYISRRCSIPVSFVLALVASSVLAQSSAHTDSTSQTIQQSSLTQPLRTITTLREAHSLSAEEASRGYPIHLRAVVSYLDLSIDGKRGGAFLQDATGGIYVIVSDNTEWPKGPPTPGTLVDISGVSAPGEFAPIIVRSRIRVIAPSHLPLQAMTVTLSRLLTGTDDCRWVEIEGVVRNVLESGAHVTLQVAMADGTIGATTVKLPGVDYNRLVDATVRIRGNAGTMFNSKRQMTGSRLYFPGLQTLTVVEPGRADIFAQPAQPLSSLSLFKPTLSWPHRVHVRGTVTLHWPGRNLCIEDDTQGLCAQSSQTTPLAVGSSADLAGFTTLAGFRPSLDNAVFNASPGTHVIAIPVVTSEEALKGDHDSEPVTIKASLIGRDLEAHDTTLILESGKSVFRAILPNALTNSYLSTIRIGSTLNVTGICAVQFDSSGTLLSYGGPQALRFSILLRSPQDVVVIRTPSWWTADRLRLLLPFALVITLAVAIWVFVLRRRVEGRTRELSESRELYRHMALHDTLTGLPTRTLLHDHLQTGLERSKRFKKGLALLMLDLDNFKQINDSFGHDCGDQVLRITAQRLSSIIRKTDSVARMGGDEFIVLLNDLVNPGQAERIAAKVVASLSRPVHIGRLEVAVSASVGVCTISDGSINAEVLLKRVDTAMYRAKARGRGCFQVFTNDLIPAAHSQPAATVPPDAAPCVQREMAIQTTSSSDPTAL
jgi:diguanylate cyclase (GGDEF)-like protein